MFAFCILLLELVASSSPRFTYYSGCAPGSFGPTCDGVCECTAEQDCDDGITGGGQCCCSASYFDQCNFSVVNISISSPDERFFFFTHSDRLSRRDVSVHGVYVTPLPLQGTRVVVGNKLNSFLSLNDSSSSSSSALEGWLDLLSAHKFLPSHLPYAYNYGGHQFGSWAGQLGDGRSICLGIHPTLGEICLKGSGRTVFSRQGDGRAALANACREFLADTALVALGVPSFRSLALFTSETHDVFRDAEYNKGRRDATPAAIIVRAGPSFLRVGTIQLTAKRQPGKGLESLVEFVLLKLSQLEHKDDEAVKYYDRFSFSNQNTDASHFDVLDAHVATSSSSLRSECFFGSLSTTQQTCASTISSTKKQPSLASARLEMFRCLLERVTTRVAALAASWSAAGFAHGVLNTDNLSLFGSTIDLNVFGFISRYDVNFTPNFIDTDQRYSYGNQPNMVKWDLLRLADALSGTKFEADREPDASTWMKGYEWLNRKEAHAIVNKVFDEIFSRCSITRFRVKLGLTPSGSRLPVDLFLSILGDNGLDFHTTFRNLGSLDLATVGGERWKGWFDEFEAEMNITQVQLSNPEYVLRTIPTRAISALAETRSFSKLAGVLSVAEQMLQNPFQKHAEHLTEPQALDLISEMSDLKDWVAYHFRSPPALADSSAQTSCGAQ